jgi:hypothetical protein
VAQITASIWLCFFAASHFLNYEVCAADEVNMFLRKTRPGQLTIKSEVDEATMIRVLLHARVVISPGKFFHYKLSENMRSISCAKDACEKDGEIHISNTASESALVELTVEQPYSIDPGICLVIKPIFPFRVRELQILQEGRFINLANLLPLEMKVSFHPAKPLVPLLVEPCDLNCFRDKLQAPPYTTFFKDVVIPTFEDSSKPYIRKIQSHYNALVDRLQHVCEEKENLIPKITHTIWVTDKSAPVLPPPEASELYVETMTNLSCAKGWRHILWVHNKADSPDLVSSPTQGLNKVMDSQVEVLSIYEHFSGEAHYPLYVRAMEEGNYGKASDIARLFILYKYGGVYRDTDFAFLVDVGALHQVCSFYAGLEHGDAIAANNAVIGASPGNLILDHALKLIASRFDSPHPLLFDVLKDRTIGTLFHTGPFLLSQSFYEKGMEDAVLMPPHVFYCPSRVTGPEGRSYKRLIWPHGSLGYHQQHKSWV